MAAKSNTPKKHSIPKTETSTIKNEDIKVVHETPAASDLSKLDRLIHERIRLGIVSALAVNDTLTFTELKRLIDTTDGNLSIHARKLEEADYITCTKSFDGRTPKTEFALTKTGRKAFDRYLSQMESIIKVSRKH